MGLLPSILAGANVRANDLGNGKYEIITVDGYPFSNRGRIAEQRYQQVENILKQNLPPGVTYEIIRKDKNYVGRAVKPNHNFGKPFSKPSTVDQYQYVLIIQLNEPKAKAKMNGYNPANPRDMRRNGDIAIAAAVANVLRNYIKDIRSDTTKEEPSSFSKRLYSKLTRKAMNELPLRFRTYMSLAETVGRSDALPYLLAAARICDKIVDGTWKNPNRS